MAEKILPELPVEHLSRIACDGCGVVLNISSKPPLTATRCPKCGKIFLIPGRFGRFILSRRLGSGATGATFRAYARNLGRTVALKIMRRSLARDKAQVKVFLAEGRTLSKLDHPNVVRVYSFGMEAGFPCIVMELIPGGGLEEHFSLEDAIPEITAVSIVTDIARGLEAVLKMNLIHGDIKPGNILLDARNRAKIVDFGITELIGKFGRGKAQGTPYYIPPEVLLREPVDHRADIYSLGATMFHMLAAWPPFYGKTIEEVVKARFDTKPPNLKKVRPGLQTKTAEIVSKMLEVSPKDRYGTYEELISDLNHVRGLIEMERYFYK